MEDCLRRARSATYWSWVRGSRLFFWRFPEEFLDDARDGVPFWKLTTAPPSDLPNYPGESREAEIEARKKVFKL